MKKGIKLITALSVAFMFTITSYAAGKDLLKSNIPQIYGKAKGASEGASDLTIIHIQDAHGNVEAQENIQSIIKTLAEQGKIDAISEEGSWWESQMKGFEAIDNQEGASEIVADFWTKYSIVTGSERYKILDDRKMPLIGNEDEALNKSNVDAFKNSNSNKKESMAAAEKIKGAMEALKLKIFDDNSRKFLQAIEDFANDKITLTTYAKALQQEAENAKVKWNTYNNFNKVIESITLEDSIDFAKIDRERLDLVDELETKVEKKVSDEIVTKSLNYRLGRLSAADYYEFLLTQSANAKIDMAKYESVVNYSKLVKLYAEINDDELFAEAERLENAVKAVLFKTDAQINFDKHFKNLEVITKMISLEMTRVDLAFYNENKPSAVKAIAFLKDQAKSLNLAIEINEAFGKIDQNLASNEKFYQIAMKRDEVMVEKTLAMMDERGFKTVVLVAGGFHTEGIIKALQAKTVSHMIITPRITNPDAPNFHDQYMLGEETEASKILKNVTTTTLDQRNTTAEQKDSVAFTLDFLNARAKGEDAGKTTLSIDEILSEHFAGKDVKNINKSAYENVTTNNTTVIKALSNADKNGFSGEILVKSVDHVSDASKPLVFPNGRVAMSELVDGNLVIYVTARSLEYYNDDIKALEDIITSEVAQTVAQLTAGADKAAQEKAIFDAQAKMSAEYHIRNIIFANASSKVFDNATIQNAIKLALDEKGEVRKQVFGLLGELNVNNNSTLSFIDADGKVTKEANVVNMIAGVALGKAIAESFEKAGFMNEEQLKALGAVKNAAMELDANQQVVIEDKATKDAGEVFDFAMKEKVLNEYVKISKIYGRGFIVETDSMSNEDTAKIEGIKAAETVDEIVEALKNNLPVVATSALVKKYMSVDNRSDKSIRIGENVSTYITNNISGSQIANTASVASIGLAFAKLKGPENALAFAKNSGFFNLDKNQQELKYYTLANIDMPEPSPMMKALFEAMDAAVVFAIAA